MLVIKLDEFAYQELKEAISWYELQSDGLGKRFELTFKQQAQNIAKNPDWFSKEESNIFKAYLPKFPYKILYSFDKETIIIWALAHLHRKPNYWQTRVK